MHEIDVAEPGRIVLDLNRGSFEIRPGPPGESIRLEGRYDAGRFELTESYETYGETGWTYHVSFDQRGFGIRPFIQHEPSENLVRLIVPRDAPIVLEGRVGIGECDVRVPQNVNLEVDRASVTLGEASRPHDRPAPEAGSPTLKLSVSGNIGEVQVH